jgi:prenyltransferase beta subunit
MKNKIVSCIKTIAFIIMMTSAGYGLIPEVGESHGAFSFLCLSIAILIAWSDIKSFLRDLKM